MQTSRARLDQCHRMLTADVLAAGKARMDRIRALVLPVFANACVGAMSQHSPVAGFTLFVIAELGRCLVRLPAVEAVLAAWSRLAVLAMAALTFQLAADAHEQLACRSGMPAARDAKRPAFVLQILCNVKQQLGSTGITLRTQHPQVNAQHPPWSTS